MCLVEEKRWPGFDKKSLIGYSGYAWKQLYLDYYYKGVSLINGKYGKRLGLMLLFCFLCFAGVAESSAATNVVTSAQEAEPGEWKTTGNGRRYRYTQTAKFAKKTWQKIKGSVYRFDKQGYVVTGWFTYSGKKYYAGGDGKLYISRWLHKDGKYYYFLDNGALAKNRMVSIGEKTYYVNKSGERVTNSWIKKGKKKYYFSQKGVRLENTWIKYEGKFYYLGESGAMARKQWIDNKYYVGADGVRKTDCVVKGYYLDSNGKRTNRASKWSYIFVGDSRTEGIRLAIAPSNTKYIAKVSMGYSWLVSTAGPELKGYLNQNPDVSVVLALGVNDLGNIQNYISYYKSLIKKYPKTKFYVEAVTPVNEGVEAAHGYTVKNKQITSFNKKMRAAVGKSRFINTYTYLKNSGFQTSDGVHYTSDVYRKLYNFITGKIKK